MKNSNEKTEVWFVSIIPTKEIQTLWQPDDPTSVAEGSPLQSRGRSQGAGGSLPPTPSLTAQLPAWVPKGPFFPPCKT